MSLSRGSRVSQHTYQFASRFCHIDPRHAPTENLRAILQTSSAAAMCGFVVMYTHTAAADTSSARTESPAAGEGNTWVNAGAMRRWSDPRGRHRINLRVRGAARYCEDIGHAFGGHSDSELVLALYSTHDAPGLFRHLRGEFSFVIVDERAHVIKLVAARDRFGIKPLFWTVQQGRALFAAETTAFLGLGWAPEWEVDSIATSGWLAEDRTVFQGVQKLASGHWMEIGPEAALADLRTGPYWDQQYGSNSATDRDGKDDGVSIAQMIEDVCEKLVGAVRVRLRADVPMGLFLSGASSDHSMAGLVLADDGVRLALQSRVISEITDIVKPQGLEMRPQDAGLDLKSDMTLPAVLSLFPQGRIFADWVLAARGYVPGSRLRSFFAAKDKMERWHPLHRSLYMWAKTLLPNTILTGLGDRSEMRNSIEGRPPFLDHNLAEHVNALPPSVKMRYSPDESEGLAQGNADDYWWKGSGSGLRSVTEKWILREAVRPFVSEDMYRRRKVMFLAPIRWAKGGPLHLMFRRILTEESVRELGFVYWPFVQDALERGFGEAADGACFRTVVYVASWVTISDRFKKAQEQLRAEKA
ncbi:hypothetical protein ARSEF4850_001409 [Beauveria asiatica]